MNRITVGVLRGGPSNEYDVSLKTGASVLEHLPKKKYCPIDILIGKDGVWHFRGMPREPARILPHIDVVFNALHGAYGEDGGVQRLLDLFGVPYTGSGTLASARAMNKELAYQGLSDITMHVPRRDVLSVTDDLEERVLRMFRTYGPPLVVKPVTGGSSIGVTIVHGYDQLLKAIYKAFEYSPKILVEEYIDGREATCGVIENFRDETLYSTLPAEIIPQQKNTFYNYDAKYGGKTNIICPGNFSVDEKEELQRLAREVHRALDLRHYSRSDFIVASQGVYFLEVNTLPGLTSHSLVPKALEAIGCSLPEFLDHLLMLALRR